jgi:two-component system sensor histidine kinase TctE
MVSGLPTCRCGAARFRQAPYAALVDFYDDSFAASRCAWPCCCSRWPVPTGRGMAVIQVAETLELRETLARKSVEHAVAPGAADRA